tara:strand:- start:57 stop:428 length:372 start_codon:yes stop_codon:yes gene_type:complete
VSESIEVFKLLNEIRQRKKNQIIELLNEKAVKMPASDIDAFLKYKNVDEIKELCEQMYHSGEINRTSNYRYFILKEEQKQSKESSVSKSQIDKLKEIKVLVDLFEDGTLTKEVFINKVREKLN